MGRGRHHDHALSGEWADCRDCHVKPDLVLVFTDGVRAMPCASEENGGRVADVLDMIVRVTAPILYLDLGF